MSSKDLSKQIITLADGDTEISNGEILLTLIH